MRSASAAAAATTATRAEIANPVAPSSRDPGVCILGSHENGMAVIPPAPGRDGDGPCVLEVIRRVDQTLRTKQVKELFGLLQDAGDESVRRIQGNRLEVFLDDPKKGSRAFDRAMLASADATLQGAKDVLISYAKAQARRDPRIGSNYEFQNFTLIISDGHVSAQDPHIDTRRPNAQFGLVLTDDAPGTLFHDAAGEDEGLRSVDDLIRLWSDQVGDSEDGEDIPRALSDEIRGNAEIQQLMESYGAVLAPRDSFRMREPTLGNDPRLDSGTLCSLPGSVVHAGPESAAPHRAVLFFSAQPLGDGTAYDPDTQFVGPILVATFIEILWTRPGVEYEERLFLLRRMLHHLEDHCGIVSDFLLPEDGCFTKFVQRVECTSGRGRDKKDELAMAAARIEHMFRRESPLLSADPRSAGLPNAVRASVDDLAVCWGNGVYDRAIVFWRSGSPSAVGTPYNVALCYPADENPETSWEGNGINDRYTLKMDVEGELFDSSNGTLRDSDGKKIVCCIMRKHVGAISLPPNNT